MHFHRLVYLQIFILNVLQLFFFLFLFFFLVDVTPRWWKKLVIERMINLETESNIERERKFNIFNSISVDFEVAFCQDSLELLERRPAVPLDFL